MSLHHPERSSIAVRFNYANYAHILFAYSFLGIDLPPKEKALGVSLLENTGI